MDLSLSPHAMELRERLVAIIPGAFRTDIARHWAPEKEKTLHAAIRRFGEPDEIVTTALYLASDNSKYTTGAYIRVDGGRVS